MQQYLVMDIHESVVVNYKTLETTIKKSNTKQQYKLPNILKNFLVNHIGCNIGIITILIEQQYLQSLS